MKVPITWFKSVEFVYPQTETVTLVCRDPFAGRKNRYSVIRIKLKTGRAYHIGRELTFGHSKRLAAKAE